MGDCRDTLPYDDQAEFEREWAGRPEELKAWREKQFEENREFNKKAEALGLPKFLYRPTSMFATFDKAKDYSKCVNYDFPPRLITGDKENG